jgi:hypothetical protein
MTDKIFASGLIFKMKEKAPDYVKGSLSIKVDEFIDFLKANESKGWVNIDLKVSKDGKPYAELNTWKPETDETRNSTANEDVAVENIPF